MSPRLCDMSALLLKNEAQCYYDSIRLYNLQYDHRMLGTITKEKHSVILNQQKPLSLKIPSHRAYVTLKQKWP